VSHPSAHARDQYASTTGNLTARMALHDYGTNPESWWQWLSSRLPRAGRVLEVGAGTGSLWQHVERPAAPLTLVDFSAAMCAQLRRIPSARVLRADAAHLPFADRRFDTVIANHMLYHVDDPMAALASFARVLAPGGRIAVAVNGPDHMAELYAVAGNRPAGRINDFDASTGPGAMASFFDDVTVSRYPDELVVPSVEPILAYLDSWQVLTPSQRSQAATAVQRRIDADGAFRIGKHSVLITGRSTYR
jgi:ubiquinone/menaquinone biosynthesis C-methylase UbiE